MQFLAAGRVALLAALLACFRNERTDQAFTVALLLYLGGDGRAEKVYCFSPDERSIAGGFCAGLASTERLPASRWSGMRGFRPRRITPSTTTWFATCDGSFRPKAMDMFNQTVAVKDIQSLNRFIRDHMLETKPWGEKVDSLLEPLHAVGARPTRAWKRVRRQDELLEPIARKPGQGLPRTGRAASSRSQAACSTRPTRSSARRPLTCSRRSARVRPGELERDGVRRKKEQLGHDLAEAQEECRRLKNEMEQAGGERMRQMPAADPESRIGRRRRRKQEARRRCSFRALREAGIEEAVSDAASFATDVQSRPYSLWGASCTNSRCRPTAGSNATSGSSSVAKVREAFKGEDDRELEALSRRSWETCPSRPPRAPSRSVRDLRLSEKDLPFAAEDMLRSSRREPRMGSVDRDGPARLRPQPARPASGITTIVGSRYIDRTRLVDAAGRGQKLVYRRVGERACPRRTGQCGDRAVAAAKDQLSRGIRSCRGCSGELADRFDYRCCETVEEFQEAQGLAMTRQRHVKVRGVRHEKDDRDRVTDPRHFVLGWDNHDKRRRLGEEIRRLREELGRLDQRTTALEQELTSLRSREAAAHKAREVEDFTAVDHAAHEREIESLRLEQQRLEENNDDARSLKRAARPRGNRAARLCRRRATRRSRAEGETGTGGRRGGAADRERPRPSCERRKAEGAFARHAKAFADLDASFTEQPLTAGSLFDQERALLDGRRAEADRLRREIEPLKDELGKLMNRFLREFPQERADLEGTCGVPRTAFSTCSSTSAGKTFLGTRSASRSGSTKRSPRRSGCSTALFRPSVPKSSRRSIC